MSDAINDGGPAFPVSGAYTPVNGRTVTEAYAGMSLRDYFAARFMQSLAHTVMDDARKGGISPAEAATVIATSAYLLADTMIKARERT